MFRERLYETDSVTINSITSTHWFTGFACTYDEQSCLENEYRMKQNAESSKLMKIKEITWKWLEY